MGAANATPFTGASSIDAKTTGAPALPAASASGTRNTSLPLVPTSRSPFGSAASSRALSTVATTSRVKPAATVKAAFGAGGDGPAA